MQVPLHLTFHNLDKSEAIEARVRQKVDHLDQLYPDRLTSCRVAIESPHRRQQKGHPYHIRIFLGVPGGEIAITRDPEVSGSHENMNAAIRDAFDAAERRLKDYIRLHRGDVKTHGLTEKKLQGRILNILADQSGGFIETAEGQVYFSRNSVIGAAFDELKLGQPVELAVEREDSAKGLQASTVQLLRTMRYDPNK
jgi:ribosome-associated translation inhibitor RaiA/cold shock CspA family protein